MTWPAMDAAETDQLPVFQLGIHPGDSDNESLITFFCFIHKEDPALATRLMAFHWEAVEREATFSVVSSSCLASKHQR